MESSPEDNRSGGGDQKIDTSSIYFIQHIFREGNQLADYLANEAANEDRTLTYNSFNQLPKQGRQIININKTQIPTIKIRTRRIRVQQ